MRTSTLLARNLRWYWRTNLAVLLGVATAAGVLGGALLVGDSVRASLRDLVLARLGRAAYVVASLLLELHRQQETILIVVTHSAELAAKFPARYELHHANLHPAGA